MFARISKLSNYQLLFGLIKSFWFMNRKQNYLYTKRLNFPVQGDFAQGFGQSSSGRKKYQLRPSAIHKIIFTHDLPLISQQQYQEIEQHVRSRNFNPEVPQEQSLRSSQQLSPLMSRSKDSYNFKEELMARRLSPFNKEEEELIFSGRGGRRPSLNALLSNQPQDKFSFSSNKLYQNASMIDIPSRQSKILPKSSNDSLDLLMNSPRAQYPRGQSSLKRQGREQSARWSPTFLNSPIVM